MAVIKLSPKQSWRILCQEYGFDGRPLLCLKHSYLPISKEQMDNFGKEYTPNKTFVCKKNVQRKKVFCFPIITMK